MPSAWLPDDLRTPLRRRFGQPRPWDPGVRFDPPMCPPNMITGPPSFVGVGAQKSGTSWWFSLIRKHPAVYHTAGVHKELHYFKDYWDTAFSDEDAERYHLWFPRPAGSITGEWTPDYMASFWIPSLLRESAPDAKLLVLLRDPVDRFFSGLADYRVRGQQLNASLVSDAQLRGFYHAQLKRLEEHYSPERILVLQYEKCVEDPLAELGRSYEFLGIDLSFVPDKLTDPIHKTPGTKSPPDPRTRDALVRQYEPDVESLVMARPEIDVALWPNFRHMS